MPQRSGAGRRERGGHLRLLGGRALGEAGPSPVDIDLVVIGRPNRDDLHDAVGRARSRLGRDINTVVISASRWRAGGDPFLAELRGRPLVPLPGIPGPDDLAVSS